MKIALIQMPVTGHKETDLQTACRYIGQAAEAGAGVVVLPEMFCCPYENAAFPVYAEEADGRICRTMAEAARQNGVTLAAGSMPERDGDALYNTCFVFDNTGQQIARHRKVHLFDINIAGGQRFLESETLSPGSERTVFTVDGVKLGLCICFDVRFPDLFRAMVLDGAQAVLVPAAFNMTTGPMHWELTFRARAVDHQIYTLGIAPARDERSSYVSYANSIVCSPWGSVLTRAGTGPELLLAELDFGEVTRVRQQLPLLSARREDVY